MLRASGLESSRSHIVSSTRSSTIVCLSNDFPYVRMSDKCRSGKSISKPIDIRNVRKKSISIYSLNVPLSSSSLHFHNEHKYPLIKTFLSGRAKGGEEEGRKPPEPLELINSMDKQRYVRMYVWRGGNRVA